MKRLLSPIMLGLSLVLALPASAEMPAAAQGTATSAATLESEGEVRKVDPTQGKITLKHGPLKNLDMPPMTMVFRVQNPALLDGIQPGDKVRFHTEKVNGVFTVTALEAIKP